MTTPKLCICCALVALLLVAGSAGDAWAKPTAGRNCSGCHGTAYDAGTVTGYTGASLDPDGAGPLVARKYFDVAPGGVIPLSFTVSNNNGGDNYAAALLQLGVAAINSSPTRFLSYATTVPGWTASGSGTSKYYYTPSPYTSPLGTKTFNLTVDPSVLPDIYTLIFNVAGGQEDWYDTETFYLRILAANLGPIANPGGPYGEGAWTGPGGWGNPGRSITLDGSASSDPDGIIASYSWKITTPDGTQSFVFDSGSGTPGSTVFNLGADFPWAMPGWSADPTPLLYGLTLTVTDNGGATNSASTTLYIPEPASLALLGLAGLASLLRRRRQR
jgi:hypothetical protein